MQQHDMVKRETPTLMERIVSLILPSIVITVNMLVLSFTCLLNPKDVLTLNISSLQTKAFARFWFIVGRALADDFPSPDLDDMLAQSRGLILDVGPGAGFQLKRFTAAAKSGRIQMIYGVEPGVGMHPTLEVEAEKAGLKGKYRVLPCGVQMEQLIPALEKQGLLKRGAEAVFDEIVCLRVLCGVPSYEASFNGLYKLLRPGGRFVIFEHVVNSGDSRLGGSLVSKYAQYFYTMMGWRFWAGGCNLMRDTLPVLKKAADSDGGWAKIDVRPRKPWSVVPEIYGTLVKKS